MEVRRAGRRGRKSLSQRSRCVCVGGGGSYILEGGSRKPGLPYDLVVSVMNGIHSKTCSKLSVHMASHLCIELNKNLWVKFLTSVQLLKIASHPVYC